MDSSELRSLQEAYLDVYEELDETFRQTKVPFSVRQDAEANRVGSRRFSDLGGHAALKAGGGQAALKAGSSVSDTLRAGKQALSTKSQQDFNNRINSYRKSNGATVTSTPAKKPMDDFAAGGGNAKMKQTGMTRDQVVAQGKKNLANSYEPDMFDVILEYLVTEGYADTNQNALVIMANMSEEWRENIVELTQTELNSVSSSINQNTRNASIRKQQPGFQSSQSEPQKPTGVSIPGSSTVFNNVKKVGQAIVGSALN